MQKNRAVKVVELDYESVTYLRVKKRVISG